MTDSEKPTIEQILKMVAEKGWPGFEDTKCGDNGNILLQNKDGRILYKFSHSVAQGGNVFIQKTTTGTSIEDKEGLRTALNDIAIKHKLIDHTIKIYDAIFFFFFHIFFFRFRFSAFGNFGSQISEQSAIQFRFRFSEICRPGR